MKNGDKYNHHHNKTLKKAKKDKTKENRPLGNMLWFTLPNQKWLMVVDVAKRDGRYRFKVILKRWVTECSFAWLEKNQGL